MEFCALASGSSGNCFYIGNTKNNDGILIDAGISAKKISESLLNIKRNPKHIKGIFITHEHSDHIKGADVFARRFNIPIFATKKTIDAGFLCSNSDLINPIKNNETLDIAKLKIEAFPKSHKAADPVSYNIFNGRKISVITDAGFACNNIIDNVSDSNLLCLESNYDEDMLIRGKYPYFLKNWIKGNEGHLSNMQSALCVLEHANSKLRNIILAHLSENNNTPPLALKTFNSLIKERKDLSQNTKISVSPRHSPTQLFLV